MEQVDTYQVRPHQVRNEGYKQIYQKLSDKRKKTLKMISKHEPCSVQDITKLYNIDTCRVSGRFKELTQRGLIIPVGIKTNYDTGHGNTFYRVTTEEEGIDIRNKTFVELRNKKDKLINDLNLKLSDLTKYAVEKEIIKINRMINTILCN